MRRRHQRKKKAKIKMLRSQINKMSKNIPKNKNVNQGESNSRKKKRCGETSRGGGVEKRGAARVERGVE